MFRQGLYLVVFLIPLQLTGCSGIPDLPNEDHVKIADVLYSVRCQLAKAIQKNKDQYTWLKTWAASVKLRLKVIETGEQSGGASLVVPITHGTFTIGFTAGLTEKATRTATVEATFDFSDIKCPDLPETKDRPVYIQGSLGLEEWIGRVTAALEASQTLPSTIAYSVIFNLKANGSLTPSFKVIPSSGRTLGANLKLAGTREDEHSLEIQAAKKKDQGTKPRQTMRKTTRTPTQYQTPAGPETQKFFDLKGVQTSIDNLENSD